MTKPIINYNEAWEQTIFVTANSVTTISIQLIRV